jgi:hypothetical protein
VKRGWLRARIPSPRAAAQGPVMTHGAPLLAGQGVRLVVQVESPAGAWLGVTVSATGKPPAGPPDSAPQPELAPVPHV